MADTKIEVKIGNIAFAGEGDKAWLAEQLDKILDRAAELSGSTFESEEEDSDEQDKNKSKGKSVTLASFLKAKNATSNQNAKFLATAVWLDERAGQPGTHTSGDITKALSDNHQSKLKNASSCLSRNIAKGFCEKKGRRFYVTDEGRKSLK